MIHSCINSSLIFVFMCGELLQLLFICQIREFCRMKLQSVFLTEFFW